MLTKPFHLILLTVTLCGSAGCDSQTDATKLQDATVLAPDVEPERADSAVDAGAEDATAADEGLVARDMAPMIDQGQPVEVCDPPVTVSPARSFSAVYDLVTLLASGGSGNYRFAFQQNESGAILNELTGAYLAGSIQGTSDEVVVSDTQCSGTATATISVVTDLEIRPATTEILAGGRLTFEASGGSGDYSFEMIENNSGGQVDEFGLYLAGEELGEDRVRMSDPATGLEVDAVIEVVQSLELEVRPGRLFAVEGASVPIQVLGGSGWLDATFDDEVVDFDAETRVLTGLAPGRSVLRLDDRFVEASVDLTVDIAGSMTAPLVPVGRASNSRRVIGPGDLNGDGFPDAILGQSEGSQLRLSDGLVAVYSGAAGGLLTEPTQVLAGSGRDAGFGRSIVVADFNADGAPDLAVGAPGDDTGAGNAGSVFVFSGLANGFFADEPSLVLTGNDASDQVGVSLAACDFNGDGFIDLAAGGPGIENRRRDNSLRDQGGALIFLGSIDGLGEAPSAEIDGESLNGDGEVVARNALRFGTDMAAADFNGDGLCDLAIGSSSTNLAGSRNQGAVAVYVGRPPSDDPEYPDDGGVGPRPAQIILPGEGESRDSYLGRRLAAGDLDADGRAELAIGQHGYDGEANNSGAVHVFSGGPLEGPIRTYTRTTDAQWRWSADNGNDIAGIGLAIDDVDGDGRNELLVTAWSDESAEEGATANVGAVHVFDPSDDEALPIQPSLSFFGVSSGGQFGESVASLGDIDSDGVGDLIVTSARTSDQGVSLGAVDVVNGATGELVNLALPGRLAGHRFGYAVALLDVDGDERPEAVVGTPWAGVAPFAIRAGGAWAYDSSGRLAPVAQLGGTPALASNDNFGAEFEVGDFNGDGELDLAVSALSEEFPDGLDAGYVGGAGCANRSNAGAVYLYQGADVLLADSTPAAIHFSTRGNAQVSPIAFADLNGDGRDDLVVGGPLHDNPSDSGIVEVFFGRQWAADGATTIFCEADLTIRGTFGSGNLGRAGVRLGDIDADGCEDVAVTEHRRRVNNGADSGAVWILYGWGGVGCPNAPQATLISSAQSGSQFGLSVDLFEADGGRANRLLIGAPRHRRSADNVRTGAAFMADITSLVELPRTDVDAEEIPVQVLVPGQSFFPIEGSINESWFGQSVAAFPPHLLIADQYGSYGEARRIGGARIYRWSGVGVQESARVVGHTQYAEDRFGFALAVAGEPPVLLVGAFQGVGVDAETGTAYRFELTELD